MENEAKALLLEGRNCIRMWKKKLWLIVAMAILGLVVGNVLTVSPDEQEYQASSKICSYSIDSEVFAASGNMISSITYCKLVVDMLGDDYLTAERVQEMISVVTKKNIPVIEINVHDTDKNIVARVANALAKVVVNDFNEQFGADKVLILEEAHAVSNYNNVTLKTILLKVGCMLLAAFATMVVLGIKAITSEKLVVVEDFTCGGELPIIGMIPLYEGGKLKA